VLGLPGDQVLLVQHGFALAVVQLECRTHLAAALRGLLLELVGAALFAVEVRLEAVADVEEQIDGPDSVGAGRQVLVIARRFKVQHGGPGGEDPPIHFVG